MTPADACACLRGARASVRAGSLLLTGLLAGVSLVAAPSTQSPPVRAVGAPVHLLTTTGIRMRQVIDGEQGVPAAVGTAIVPAEPPVIFSVRTTERVVALTFDLDMTPAMQLDLRTGRVGAWIDRGALELLTKDHVPATLFMTGMWAETYPALARELARSGLFEIGNHSYSHPAFRLPCYGLGGPPAAQLVNEVERSQATIEAIAGVTPAYFRFPGGCFDPSVVAMVRAHGLRPIQWSVNSIDAFNSNVSEIARAVIAGVHPGSIIVMHLMGGPNAPASGAALRQIIPALRAQGYEFATVTGLLDYGPALEPVGFKGIVEAAAPRADLGATGPASAGADGYWVWTPWGWQKLSHPPACRWQANPKTKTWVCV